MDQNEIILKIDKSYKKNDEPFIVQNPKSTKSILGNYPKL